MTEKKFRFLEQLEDDLRDAAARERVAAEVARPGRKRGSSARRGDGGWTRWIAAAVVVLVVAGGIGGFVQYRQDRPSGYRAMSNVGAAIGSGGSGSERATQGALGNATDRLASANQSYHSFAAPSATPPAPGYADIAASSGTSRSGSSFSLGGSAPVSSPDLSKIIRNGVITVELPDGKFPSTRDLVTQYADAAGGYVLSSTARGSGSGTFVLRIPANRFDTVMTQLSKLPGGHVLWQNSSSQDVTSQFVDYGAQLQILRAQRAVTLGYLKKASSLSQSIQFRDQVFQIQGQIDKLTGQLNYLKNQVALATITVNLRETGAPITHKVPPVSKPSLVRAWDRAVSGFLGVLSAVIVGLGFLIPLGILAMIIGFPIMALRRRRRAASSAS